MISCQHATQLISLSMERKLTLKEKFQLKLHLMICSLCMEFQKQAGIIRKLLRSYHPNNEKRLSQQAKENIKKRIKNS